MTRIENMNSRVFIPSLLLGLLQLFPLNALDRIDVKAAWQKKNYALVIGMSEKYPSLFNSGELAFLLAQSLLEIKKVHEAASVCFKAAIQEKHEGCYSLLRDIRKSSPREYRFGLGKANFELGDMGKSFRAFYSLIDENPDDQNVRNFLVKIFKYLQENDQVWEQLQYIKEPSQELESYATKISNQVLNIGNRLEKNPSLLQEKWQDGIYLYAIASKKPTTDAVSFLKSLYEKKLTAEPDLLGLRLRLANLFFAQKKIENAKNAIQELEKEPLSARLTLSLSSLKLRMSLENETELAQSDLPSANESTKKEQSPPKALVSFETKDSFSRIISEVKKLNLSPVDLSELPLATASDLGPIQRVEDAIRSRLDAATSDYEKRYLIIEIDRAENELLIRESSAEALDSYLRSPKGRAMRKLVEKYESEFEPADRENSKQFNGEYDRFQKAISTSKSEKERKRVLQGFLDRWWRLSEGEGVNLLTQGALKAYSESREGKKLAREVYKLGLELKLNPTNLKLGEAFFQDRGF